MRDLKHLQYFEELLQAANNDLVREAKNQGRICAAYLCENTPEPLMNLGNCFGVRLFAPNTGSMDIAGFAKAIYDGFCGMNEVFFLTLFCGYVTASKNLLFKPIIQFFIMFTMFFSGGMIPAYLNVRELGLYNSLWALILPGAMSVYNAIICRTAIQAVPESLTESAYLDGANDIVVVFRIILPLIMPTIAVLLLYYGVGHWNAWFNASLYLADNEKLPIQNVMRSILIANSNVLNSAGSDNDMVNQYAEAIKYSTIILTTVPVLCIYPFLQKYFVKGVMVGAVKG